MHKKYSTKYIIERADLTADLGQFISKQKKLSLHQAITRHSFFGWFVVGFFRQTRDNKRQALNRGPESIRVT